MHRDKISPPLHRMYFSTPVGVFCGEDDGEALTALYVSENQPEMSDQIASPLLKKTEQELGEYFEGKRKSFDLPLRLHGTEFQKKVWEALRQIPYGETRSYQDIARIVGNPVACRAVGGANHRNPVLILVPCHRVIGSNGTLTGYGGGLEMKQYLLELEMQKGKIWRG